MPDTTDPRAILAAYLERHRLVRLGHLADFEDVPRLVAAVTEALAHHQPQDWSAIPGMPAVPVCPLCSHADGKAVTAPCHEVRGIIAALNGEETDDV